MAKFVFKVAGHDLTPFIEFAGLKYTVYGLDSEDTTRSLSGNLLRKRVAVKVRWDVPIKPVTTSQVQQILGWVAPEEFSVEATDLQFGLRTSKFYCNNVDTSVVCSTGTDANNIYWEGLVLPIVEM